MKKRKNEVKRRIPVREVGMAFAVVMIFTILVGLWIDRTQTRLVVPAEELEPRRSSPTLAIIQPSSTPAPTITRAPTLEPTPSIDYLPARVTFYGWPDNDPAGRVIAYPKAFYGNAIHEAAGGTGTYQDPITMAASEDFLAVGTRAYVPYLRKYVVKEDWCESCGTDPMPHIDIWMESGEAHTPELFQCQNHFTRQSVPIEVDPPAGRPVNTTPLFDQANGRCVN